MADADLKPTGDDITWAHHFKAIYTLLEHCEKSEKATLLLSTCRNAYMTLNALFSELQEVMGDVSDPPALRGGSELLLGKELDAIRIRDRFGRAIQTLKVFEQKRDVWLERNEVWADIEQAKRALAQTDGLAAREVDLVLGTVRVPDKGMGDGFDYELLGIDLQPRPHLQALFDKIDTVYTLLGHLARLGWRAGIAMSRRKDTSQQLELEVTNPDDIQQLPDNYLYEVVNDIADACGWSIVRTPAGHVVELANNYSRPQNSANNITIAIPVTSHAEAVASFASSLGALIREGLYFAHGELVESFRPNVAKPPMPSIFSIALPPPVQSERRGALSPLKLHAVRCTTSDKPSDVVRIGLAHLALPFKDMNGGTYRIPEEKTKVVTADIRKAIRVAKESGCQAIVFPEYSMPRMMHDELCKLSESEQLIIIGGLEGEWKHGKLLAQALILIPGEHHAHFQCKQEQSLEEEAGDSFYRDGEVRLFCNSPIGDFSVIVCSDFLQLSSLQTWTPDVQLPELLFVVARNTYHDLYVSFAKADAVRLYTSVVISNVVDEDDNRANNQGSCVVVPSKNDMVLTGTEHTVAGHYTKSVHAYDVSLRAIRAKSRGKPESGYLTVPKSAQRT